ncbi:MAG TPA: TetR/AcrR family transcriptional regulator [Candidatus Binataceae bacterium]|nr:TetR/AcrR family transcriptional regulator [Candidatus Binataceae bacterium]
MSGVKQFKTGDVLDRAMAVFWRRGYQATSIQDLIEATGINRGSLYATFGDKQRLFLAVLDHYMEQVGKPMLAELNEPNPRRAIERLFAAIIRRNSDPAWPRGCLATNTALECPGAGDEINRKIAANLGQIESAIYRVLRRAQTDGSLEPNQDARSLARYFLGVAQGLNVVNKAFADPAILQDIVETSMSVWKAPQAEGVKRTARSGPTV